MKIIPAGVEKTRGMAGGKWGDVYIVRREPEYDYSEEMRNAPQAAYNNLANIMNSQLAHTLQGLVGPCYSYCPYCGRGNGLGQLLNQFGMQDWQGNPSMQP